MILNSIPELLSKEPYIMNSTSDKFTPSTYAGLEAIRRFQGKVPDEILADEFKAFIKENKIKSIAYVIGGPDLLDTFESAVKILEERKKEELDRIKADYDKAVAAAEILFAKNRDDCAEKCIREALELFRNNGLVDISSKKKEWGLEPEISDDEDYPKLNAGNGRESVWENKKPSLKNITKTQPEKWQTVGKNNPCKRGIKQISITRDEQKQVHATYHSSVKPERVGTKLCNIVAFKIPNHCRYHALEEECDCGEFVCTFCHNFGNVPVGWVSSKTACGDIVYHTNEFANFGVSALKDGKRRYYQWNNGWFEKPLADIQQALIDENLRKSENYAREVLSR